MSDITCFRLLDLPQPMIVFGRLDGSIAAHLLTGLTREATELITPGQEAACVIQLSEGILCAGHTSGRVTLWDLQSGMPAGQIQTDDAVDGVVVLSGGRQILTVSRHRKATLWRRTNAGYEAFPILNQLVDSAASVAGIPEAVILHQSFAWSVWDANSGSVRASFAGVDPRGLLYLDGVIGVSANGRYFFVYWDDYQVFDTITGEELRLLPTPWKPISGSLSEDGQTLALGTKDGEVIAIDAQGKTLQRVKVSEEQIFQVQLRNGQNVAWMDRRNAIGVLDIGSGAELVRVPQR